MQRRSTAAFIAADPIDLALSRPVWSSDGAGGRIADTPLTLNAQRFRLIPQVDAGLFRITADGRQVNPEFRLLGVYDADLQRGDRFDYNGATYEVVAIADKRDYQTKAEVTRVG